MTRKPNILFVMADQMRATAMGCAGVEQVLTPHFDRFATQGTRFTRAIANTPCCCPSRATLLTGRHVLSHGVVANDVPLRTDLPTLAHSLNQEGYRCGYIGKWHLDRPDRGIFIPPGPRRQGFDDFWAVANCNHNYFRSFHYLDDDPRPRWVDGYEPEFQTDLAVDSIRRAALRPDPFCLVISWGPPHCPYEMVPDRFRALYPPDSIQFLPNAVDADVQDPETIGKASRPATLSAADRRRRKQELIAGYYAHVTALDTCFGRVMAALERAGCSENTLVVFMSDHGDMLFSQNRGWKSKPWRESVNVPFLVRFPGQVPAGRVSPGLISIVDMMPTLLGLAGTEVPPGVEGEDLSCLLRGDDSAALESAWINYPVSPAWFSYEAWRGVVTPTHTYARFRDRPWVLYDDTADPFQQRNLLEGVAVSTLAVSAEDGGPSRFEAGTLPLLAELDDRVYAWLEKTADAFEPSADLADRLLPGHEGNVPSAYYSEEILRGYAGEPG